MNEKVLAALGRAYVKCVNDAANEYAQKNPLPKDRNSWVGTRAGELWVRNELPRHTGRTLRSVEAEPYTAVSTLGDAKIADAFLSGERVMFELKTSNYRNARVREQEAAQVFDLGLGTRGATALCRIYGAERRIDVILQNQAAEAVAAAQGRRGEFVTPEPDTRRSVRF